MKQPGTPPTGAAILSTRNIARWIAALLTVLAAATGACLLPGPASTVAAVRRFDIKATQYAYSPSRIVVGQGDEVHLRLASGDVVHGFYLEGQPLNAYIYPGRLQFKVAHLASDEAYMPVEEMVFTANHFGKFRFRCSVTCGTLHPFMQGELIVRPNYPFRAGMGAAAGLLLSGLFLMATGKRRPPQAGRNRLDLLQTIPLLGRMVRQRWLPFALTLPGLALFLLFIIAGIWGSPIGNRNIIITFVWILWWFLLITVMLPFGSRIWCMVCPFPFFGEWLQRGRLIGVGRDPRHMWRGYRRWPVRFTNIWAQNILFLGLCTTSAVLVTRPVTSAVVLFGLALAATGLAAVFRGRAFCSYICPVSGFLSLYAMAAVVEVRAKDPEVCRTCRTKSCATGSDSGWGCPWSCHPGRLDRNNYCGMCMTCIKTCPNGNMTINLRPFCADTRIKGKDEAFKALIMISVALVYSITLLGSWGTVKSWANISEVGNWRGFLVYAGAIWVTSLAVLPGIWGLACLTGRRMAGASVRTEALFRRYAFMLVPLGLAAWIAFSIPLVMVNWSYILATVSDPLGWGWDLFGTADIAWRPLYPETMVYVQIPVLLFGLSYALKSGFDIAGSLLNGRQAALMSMIPPAVVCTAIVMGFIALFAG